VLSGPAGGVTGVVALGSRYGLEDLISLDMGGTSLDVCLVQGGMPPVVPVQTVDAHPILCSSVDIHTVGAGGGSIAFVDRAREAVGRVADELGLSLAEATHGILAITIAQITRALRRGCVPSLEDPQAIEDLYAAQRSLTGHARSTTLAARYR
jgi:hypothetical protein